MPPQLDTQEQIAELGEAVAKTLREVAAGRSLKTPYTYVFKHEGKKYALMLLDYENESA